MQKLWGWGWAIYVLINSLQAQDKRWLDHCWSGNFSNVPAQLLLTVNQSFCLSFLVRAATPGACHSRCHPWGAGPIFTIQPLDCILLLPASNLLTALGVNPLALLLSGRTIWTSPVGEKLFLKNLPENTVYDMLLSPMHIHCLQKLSTANKPMYIK